MIGKKFIYKCGVDEFTNCYETSFEATHDGCICTMITYDIDKSFVRFDNGEEEFVESMHLMELTG